METTCSFSSLPHSDVHLQLASSSFCLLLPMAFSEICVTENTCHVVLLSVLYGRNVEKWCWGQKKNLPKFVFINFLFINILYFYLFGDRVLCNLGWAQTHQCAKDGLDFSFYLPPECQDRNHVSPCPIYTLLGLHSCHTGTLLIEPYSQPS